MSKLNGPAILHELQVLRNQWRAQNFRYTLEQKNRYELLTQLRRARVNQLIADGQVWEGPSNFGSSPVE